MDTNFLMFGTESVTAVSVSWRLMDNRDDFEQN